MKKIKIAIVLYILVIASLFLYSYTQIDLNLHLSRLYYWQNIQNFFQHIGYFQRPLSTYLYIGITTLLFIFYLLFLRAVNKKYISRNQVWFLVIATTVILSFAYNAFSYDLFNYIFDAKIITFYHQSPYAHKALDFPYDHMLSFMHWTHRLYPYGPAWLVLTVPLSFLGLNFFTPTLFLFKFLASISFLGTTFFIGKILKKIYPEDELFGIAFFALNPLIIIESLVSAHNDIVMMFFAIFSFYLFIRNKYVISLLLLIISIGIKFATAVMIPIFAFLFFLKKEVNWLIIFLSIVLMMVLTIILASIRTNFQPWYLLYPLPFCALISKKYYIFIPSVIISLFGLMQYVPFLYLGNWDKPVPSLLFYSMIVGIILSIVGVLFKSSRTLMDRKQHK